MDILTIFHISPLRQHRNLESRLTTTLEQDLKDFARGSSLDVVYSETGREGNGRG